MLDEDEATKQYGKTGGQIDIHCKSEQISAGGNLLSDTPETQLIDLSVLIANHRSSTGQAHHLILSLPAALSPGDSNEHLSQSTLRLFEDGKEMGPAHSHHDVISKVGGGRFSHWRHTLYFSSSDGTDPARNGKVYVALIERAVVVRHPNSRRLEKLRNFRHDQGFGFTVALPKYFPSGNTLEWPRQSSLRLFEDGVELGPRHASVEDVQHLGAGRFTHWGGDIWFSSSDGTDPTTNQREYLAVAGQPRSSAISQAIEGLSSIELEELDDDQRYNWAEVFFNALVRGERLAETRRSFFHDKELLADYERFDTRNYRSLDRKFALKELLKLVQHLDGDIAECGVFQGSSSYLLAKHSAAANRHVHLFDSFQGLSKPGQLDGAYWKAGDLSCSLEVVLENLKEFALRIHGHKGWIPDRFADVTDKRFCFMHLDVDLYQPTLDALQFFGPRMVAGGIIVCDDYGSDLCPGARRAMDEYAGEIDLPVVHLPTAQGVIFFKTDI